MAKQYGRRPLPDRSNSFRRGSQHFHGVRSFTSPLEQVLADMPMPITRKGVLDLNTTNRARLDYALKKKLAPVLIDTTLHYRSVVIDGRGLMQIAYSPEIPGLMPALKDDELIMVNDALEIFGINQEELKRKFSEGQVRRAGPSYLYLADLGGLISF